MNEDDSFAGGAAQLACVHVAREAGFTHIQRESLLVLADLFSRYLGALADEVRAFTELRGRAESNLLDLAPMATVPSSEWTDENFSRYGGAGISLDLLGLVRWMERRMNADSSEGHDVYVLARRRKLRPPRPVPGHATGALQPVAFEDVSPSHFINAKGEWIVFPLANRLRALPAPMRRVRAQEVAGATGSVVTRREEWAPERRTDDGDDGGEAVAADAHAAACEELLDWGLLDPPQPVPHIEGIDMNMLTLSTAGSGSNLPVFRLVTSQPAVDPTVQSAALLARIAEEETEPRPAPTPLFPEFFTSHPTFDVADTLYGEVANIKRSRFAHWIERSALSIYNFPLNYVTLPQYNFQNVQGLRAEYFEIPHGLLPQEAPKIRLHVPETAHEMPDEFAADIEDTKLEHDAMDHDAVEQVGSAGPRLSIKLKFSLPGSAVASPMLERPPESILDRESQAPAPTTAAPVQPPSAPEPAPPAVVPKIKLLLKRPEAPPPVSSDDETIVLRRLGAVADSTDDERIEFRRPQPPPQSSSSPLRDGMDVDRQATRSPENDSPDPGFEPGPREFQGSPLKQSASSMPVDPVQETPAAEAAAPTPAAPKPKFTLKFKAAK